MIPHNRIRASTLLDAMNPTLCIRCTAPKPLAGRNTLCPRCTIHLSQPSQASEAFLFDTSLRIYTLWLTLRRRLLADTITAGCDLSGTFFEHRLGVPGTASKIPRFTSIKVHMGGGLVRLDLSEHARALLEEALLASMQCDNALILLADVVRREMLARGSPVAGVEEVWFEARHPYVGSHWCYRMTLRDGRRFAVAFTDRQLGWLHVVRKWDDYVLERFDEWEMRDAIFWAENPDEGDEGGERGVTAFALGSIADSQRVKWMHEQLPPWELISRGLHHGWHMDEDLDEEKMIKLQKLFNFSLTLHKDMELTRDIWAMERVDDE